MDAVASSSHGYCMPLTMMPDSCLFTSSYRIISNNNILLRLVRFFQLPSTIVRESAENVVQWDIFLRELEVVNINVVCLKSIFPSDFIFDFHFDILHISKLELVIRALLLVRFWP